MHNSLIKSDIFSSLEKKMILFFIIAKNFQLSGSLFRLEHSEFIIETADFNILPFHFIHSWNGGQVSLTGNQTRRNILQINLFEILKRLLNFSIDTDEHFESLWQTNCIPTHFKSFKPLEPLLYFLRIFMMEGNFTIGIFSGHDFLFEILKKSKYFSCTFTLVVNTPSRFNSIVPKLFQFYCGFA